MVIECDEQPDKKAGEELKALGLGPVDPSAR